MNLPKLRLLFLLTAAVFLLSAAPAFGQASIKTANGFLFVNNDASKSFTLEVSGGEVKPLQHSQPMFQVDGRLLQILTVKKTGFAPQAGNKSDEELLDLHKIWESDYLGQEVFKQKLAVEAEKLDVAGRRALFWSFARPIHNQQIGHDCFLSTIVGDYALVLSSPLPLKGDKAATQKFLVDVLKTIKLADKTFDIEKLAAEIKNRAGE